MYVYVRNARTHTHRPALPVCSPVGCCRLMDLTLAAAAWLLRRNTCPESQRTIRVVSSNILWFHLAVPSHKSLLNQRTLFLYCPDCSHQKTIAAPHCELAATIFPLTSRPDFMLLSLVHQSFSLVYSAPFCILLSFLYNWKTRSFFSFLFAMDTKQLTESLLVEHSALGSPFPTEENMYRGGGPSCVVRAVAHRTPALNRHRRALRRVGTCQESHKCINTTPLLGQPWRKPQRQAKPCSGLAGQHAPLRAGVESGSSCGVLQAIRTWRLEHQRPEEDKAFACP